MQRLIVLVVNDGTPLHRVVMRTLERWFPQALLLDANSLQEAIPALRHCTLAAVVAGNDLRDGPPQRLLRQARLHDPRLPVFFVPAHTCDAVVDLAGATAVCALPHGLGRLVAPLQTLH